MCVCNCFEPFFTLSLQQSKKNIEKSGCGNNKYLFVKENVLLLVNLLLGSTRIDKLHSTIKTTFAGWKYFFSLLCS